MAQPTDDELEQAASVSPEELSDDLAAEIADRWDPDRLLKLVATRAGKGEALDATLRNRYERKLGVDLSHVRVYTGEFAEEFNKAHNADAVTIGNTGMILMGGSADKSMVQAAGHALLAHELTHVAQAQRGVFRHAAMGETMDLATEEHEAEAEQAEAEEMDRQKGEQAAAKENAKERAGKEAEQLAEQVKEKVIAMLGDSMRVLIQRSGSSLRRP
jgi:hypothetical protein